MQILIEKWLEERLSEEIESSKKREKAAFVAGCIFAGDGINNDLELIEEAWRAYQISSKGN